MRSIEDASDVALAQTFDCLRLFGTLLRFAQQIPNVFSHQFRRRQQLQKDLEGSDTFWREPFQPLSPLGQLLSVSRYQSRQGTTRDKQGIMDLKNN